MPIRTSLNVSLTLELEQFVQSRVASGADPVLEERLQLASAVNDGSDLERVGLIAGRCRASNRSCRVGFRDSRMTEALSPALGGADAPEALPAQLGPKAARPRNGVYLFHWSPP
jgi:hypothetical protein